MTPLWRRFKALKQNALVALFTSTFLYCVYLTKDSYQTQKTNYLLVEQEGQASSVPIIYVVTPTYSRPTQMADLTRLAQTLMLVSDIHWVVVEDALNTSAQVANLLRRTGLPVTHLHARTPARMRGRRYGKGVSTRLEALKWLSKEAYKDGVLYFADDDNAYDIRVFEEMRWTRKLSVWPVGSIGKLGVSTPIIRENKVVGFHDPFTQNRIFCIDMAGFAVAMDLWLKRPKATFPYKIGYLEDHFLKGLNITLNDMEPKANNCTQVLVWHTKTMNSSMPSKRNMKAVIHYNESNLPELYQELLDHRM